MGLLIVRSRRNRIPKLVSPLERFGTPPGYRLPSATNRISALAPWEHGEGSKATTAGQARSLPGRCTFRCRSKVWGGDDTPERYPFVSARVFRLFDRVRFVSLMLSTAGLHTSRRSSSPPSLLRPPNFQDHPRNFCHCKWRRRRYRHRPAHEVGSQVPPEKRLHEVRSSDLMWRMSGLAV